VKWTVDRAKWLRGEGTDNSYLRRASDGKMCCLGQRALHVGHPVDELVSVLSPDQLADHARWIGLIDDGNITPKAFALMTINDDKILTDEAREATLIELFASIGEEVTFV
jgi:hypothetical protein